jgi:hypothetical protein
VSGSSRHFAAGSTEFALVGDDKIFHLSTNSQNEGPGVGYRGLFLPDPSGKDWLHEIKYDGYRLHLERDGDRARLIARGGCDWTDHYRA